MTLDDLKPALDAWDRLNMAINGFVVSMPSEVTRRAAVLSAARADMARIDLPEAVQRAWSDLQQTIGAALVSAPHEMSASVERLEHRREAMRAAVWDLSKTLAPPLVVPASRDSIEGMAGDVHAHGVTFRKKVSRRSRR